MVDGWYAGTALYGLVWICLKIECFSVFLIISIRGDAKFEACNMDNSQDKSKTE